MKIACFDTKFASGKNSNSAPNFEISFTYGKLEVTNCNHSLNTCFGFIIGFDLFLVFLC